MPTPIDRAVGSHSKNAFLAFSGIITAVAVWSIWGSDLFPAEKDPVGDPNNWSEAELRRWLSARNLFPDPNASRDELLERVKANLRAPRR